MWSCCCRRGALCSTCWETPLQGSAAVQLLASAGGTYGEPLELKVWAAAESVLNYQAALLLSAKSAPSTF